ncbi:hypothetical protein ACUN8C_14610 [Kushneria sp. Sum13]|uniref:hypothetical protein n=1 Tax=Kushneria sp. Sum13 TaxID=3459196 RepID=UPI0040467767
MNDLLYLINSYRILLGAIVLLLLTALLIYRFWDRISLMVLRIHCALPGIGKVARLSKNSQSHDSQTGWFTSESELCAHFREHLEDRGRASPAFFVKCQSYLDKAQETGRRELPLLGWVLIAAMVFVEAMGFSYVLAGWTIPGASEALQQKGALGIAFLISALLVYLTHKTGQEIHHNHLVRKVRTWFNGQDGNLMPDSGVTLDNNEIDDGAPTWRQLLNRLKTNANVKPGWTITGITGAFIIAIAIGATYVRGQALDEMLSSQQMSQGSSMAGAQYQDPYSDTALPDELASIQREADSDAGQSIIDHQRKGGWGTFVVLAFIFVFLQIMGTMIGYFTGFAGKESSKACSYIGKFRNKDEYVNYHVRRRNQVIHIAQKHLSTLQQRMLNRALQYNTDSDSIKLLKHAGDRSFQRYAETSEREQRESDSRDMAHQHQTRASDMAASTVTSTPAAGTRAPIDQPAETTAMQGSTPSDEATPMDRREAIRQRLEEERRQKELKAQEEEDAAYEARLRREMGLDDGGTSS